MNQNILELVEQAFVRTDIQKHIVRGIFGGLRRCEVLTYGYEDSPLSSESLKLIIGNSFLNENQDIDDNCINTHPEAVDLLIEKIKDYINLQFM